jgi:hypothetical protein
MIYFALNEDGLLYNLGDHGDWEAAEATAEDLKINPIWLFDEHTATSWAGFISDALGG